MSMVDRDHVAAQYRTEELLLTRTSVWLPTLDGRDPATEALTLVTADRPGRVLEIGCGTGAFAALPADAALRIAVTVTGRGETVTLVGYRTRYAPNAAG